MPKADQDLCDTPARADDAEPEKMSFPDKMVVTFQDLAEEDDRDLARIVGVVPEDDESAKGDDEAPKGGESVK